MVHYNSCKTPLFNFAVVLPRLLEATKIYNLRDIYFLPLLEGGGGKVVLL